MFQMNKYKLCLCPRALDASDTGPRSMPVSQDSPRWSKGERKIIKGERKIYAHEHTCSHSQLQTLCEHYLKKPLQKSFHHPRKM